MSDVFGDGGMSPLLIALDALGVVMEHGQEIDELVRKLGPRAREVLETVLAHLPPPAGTGDAHDDAGVQRSPW